MTTTNHLAITLVEQSQAQKEITVNTALTRIDAVLNSGVVTRTLSTPPGSPAAGAVYIVGSSPTGDWTSHANHIAYFDQIWRFIIPGEGMTLWVNDEDVIYSYNGTNWQSSALVISVTLTGTAHTLDESYIRKTIFFTNSSAVTFTLPNSTYVNFICRIVQGGTGQVTFSAASGATLRNRSSHTKTAGRYAVCTLEVMSNSGGAAAEYLLSGDTAA